MSALLGVSGAKRNACAAVCIDGHARAACEQERLTRVRRVGLGPDGLPSEAIDEVLALSGRTRADVATYVVAEPRIQLPPTLPTRVVDHHEAHAATAFLTSPFERSAVLVCDSHPTRDTSVWLGDGSRLEDQRWPWRGPGFGPVYSACAEVLGFSRHGQEHQLEAVAHLGHGRSVDRLQATFRYVEGSLDVDPGWRAVVSQLMERDRLCGEHQPVGAASAVQRRIGEVLLELVADVHASVATDALCLGGGLFFNTYFTTLIRRSGIFRDVFVPINPGNAGLAVGAPLLLARQQGDASGAARVSPFLGPEYDGEAIKGTLDGCKLSYAFSSEHEVLDATVEALTRGHLVGWFQGRMEWGPRALGHRSILADPQSPYVLENLNCFLRKRESWRAFGVSVCEETVADLFCGPPSSRWMEYEYGLRDDRLRHVTPPGATSIRVQTLPREAGLFWALHKRMQAARGTGVLVNTSFNGFHEPIACTPRDAVRVFYGTGLDMLVMGQFILRK